MDAKQQVGVVEQAPAPSRLAAASSGLIAILAQLALADAAIETFWAGSPIRWWVTPPALGFVALSVWMWRPGGWAARRWGWSGAAPWSIGGVLLMLAATAWLPASAAAGVRMFGREAPSFLSLVAALVVLLAVVGVARARILHIAGVVTVAALGAYAVAAFVLAFRGAVPFQVAVNGAGFWARLPVYLQGAFLGTFLVLPLSLVFEIIAALRRRPNPWRLQQTVATVLVIAVAASGWAPGTMGRESDAAGRAEPPASGVPAASLAIPVPGESQTGPLRLATRLTYDSNQVEADSSALADRIPAARYDLVALAGSLGPGVEPAFSFVRDSIRYEPYPGILRGSWSTFLTRAGNAADRSLLLGTLLAFKGVTVRYVTGRLESVPAVRLFEHAFDAPAAGAGRPLAATVPRSSPAVPDLIERVFARARRDYSVVRAALGTRLPPASTPSRQDILKEIEQHVWVQASIDGGWVDLDSSFPDATAGKSYAAVSRTFNAPPQEWCQRVTIRVKVERLEGAGLREETALSSTYNALELLDRDVFLLHVPSAGAGGGVASPTAAASADEWIPVLRVAGGEEPGRPVAFGDRAPAMQGALGGAEGASTFVAEWLEVEIADPTGAKEVTRRVLVDRAAASWRTLPGRPAGALKALARDSGGLFRAPQMVHNIWFSAGQHNLAQYAAGLAALAAALRATPAGPLDVPPDIQLGQLAFQNFAWLLVTDHLLIPALNDSANYHFFADSPRVTILSSGADPWSTADAMVVEADLRRDHLRGLARDGNAVGVAERKLWFGMLEGALEHEMLADQAAAAGIDPATVASASARLSSQGIRILTGALPPSEIRADVAARMARALGAGATLAAIPETLNGDGAAWWEIAPGNGDTRAVFGPDLNWSSLGMLNYTNSVPSRIFTMVDPMTGMSMDFPVGTSDKEAERALRRGIQRVFNEKREAALKKKKGGNEYLNLVKDVALMTMFSVAVMIIAGTVILIYRVLDYLVDRALWH
jgi:hypothetical protein